MGASAFLRRFVPLLVVVACFVTVGARKAEAQCSGCAPATLTAADGLSASTHDVCFEKTTEDESSDFDDDVQDYISAGIQNYWGAHFSSNYPVSFNFYSSGGHGTQCSVGSGDIVVKIDGSMAQNHVMESYYWNQNALEIHVNPYWIGQMSEGQWNYGGAHEMGHILGFDDVTSGGCSSSTIMFGTIQSGLPSFQSADQCASQTKYPDAPSQPWVDYAPSVHEEDCWDYWLVGYEWNEGYNSYVVVWTEFLYTDCTPPI